MTERRILENVRHPFVVKMDYAFQSDSKLFFVLEYCPGGELFFYLSQIGRFKEDDARFYASNIVVGHTEAKSICGTAEYLAPEILLNKGHGKASDWWSFGGIIYEMLCGEPPFYSKNKEKLFRNIKYSEPKLDFPFLSENARDICAKLLDKDPMTRLGSGVTDA